MPDRIPVIEANVSALQKQVDALTRRVEHFENVQNRRHEENRDTLQQIKLSLQEFTTYLKVGRWVMHAVWALLGTAAGVVVERWLSRGH